MSGGLSLVAVGHATSLFLAITFTVCVAFDLLFPSRAMYQAWQAVFAGSKNAKAAMEDVEAASKKAGERKFTVG